MEGLATREVVCHQEDGSPYPVRVIVKPLRNQFGLLLGYSLPLQTSTSTHNSDLGPLGIVPVAILAACDVLVPMSAIVRGRVGELGSGTTGLTLPMKVENYVTRRPHARHERYEDRRLRC